MSAHDQAEPAGNVLFLQFGIVGLVGNQGRIRHLLSARTFRHILSFRD